MNLLFWGPWGIVARTSGVRGALNSIPWEIEELKNGQDLGKQGPCGISKCNTCSMNKV